MSGARDGAVADVAIGVDPSRDGEARPSNVRPGWLIPAVGVGVGLVLCWLVVVRGLPVALAERWPDLALKLDPRLPQALLSKAEELRQSYYKLALASADQAARNSVGEGSSPVTAVKRSDVERRRAEIRTRLGSILKHVIRRDPLNAVAFRMLGEIEPDSRRARAYMMSALARSKREPVAVFWLLNDAMARQDRAAALEYAEVLFRTNPPLRRYAVASFAQLANDSESSKKLAERLRARPWWRDLFFGMLPELARDPRAPLNLMMALKAIGGRLSANETATYLRVLFNRKQYGLAYYVWLNLLPAEKMAKMGLLNNGGFEDESDGAPFNWQFSRPVNATVGLLPAPVRKDGERALHITMGPGRVRFPEVSQYMKLPPGRYLVSGQYRGRIKSSRGLVWRSYCIGADGRARQNGETEAIAGLARQWSDFSFEFAFDEAQGCELVLLRLTHPARTESEHFIDGEIWFDSIKLSVVQP
jgi:hypothetical protein